MKPLYHYVKDPVTKAWLHHVWLMAHRYQYGYTQVTTGMPGSGKTMTAATLCELLSKPGDFTEKNVAFTPREYIETLKNCKIGECLLWSEMGVGLSSRRWYSMSNILTAQVMQTLRIKKPIIFMDVSDLSFIDVQARKLIFNYAEIQRFQHNPPRMWIYRISINRRTGDIYYIHPMIKVNDEIQIIRNIKIRMKPSDKTWEFVDRKQREFKAGLEKSAANQLKFFEDKARAGSEGKTTYDLINEVATSKDKYTNAKGKIDWRMIKLIHKVSRDDAEQIALFINSGKTL